jgi:hypothetical protein
MLGLFSTQKMEATCSSEMLVDFQLIAHHYVPEDGILHNHQCENLKLYILKLCKLIYNHRPVSAKFYISGEGVGVNAGICCPWKKIKTEE